MTDLQELHPFRDSSDLLLNPEALQRQMQEEGYLYLSSLLPKDVVHEVYAIIIELCQTYGWADQQGFAQGSARLEGSDAWWEVYDPLQKQESFHALPHRPELLQLMEALVGETVLVHPRNIARIVFPATEFFSTPPHQDYPLIQGTPDTYTAWIPLTDCPVELGVLAVLAGSHRFGLMPVYSATGPGGLRVDTEKLNLTWHASDMQAGDVLIFHSYTVHRALPNRTHNRLRISSDYRYQGASQPIVEDSLMPHYGRLSWEQIYEGWQNEDLKYYWRRYRLNIVPRNFALQTPVA